MNEDPYAEKIWLKNYDKDVPSSIDYPKINVYEFLDNSANDFGSRTAIWFMKNKISYKNLKDIADRVYYELLRNFKGRWNCNRLLSITY